MLEPWVFAIYLIYLLKYLLIFSIVMAQEAEWVVHQAEAGRSNPVLGQDTEPKSPLMYH